MLAVASESDLAALAGNVAVLKGQSAARDDVGHGGLPVAARSYLPLCLDVC